MCDTSAQPRCPVCRAKFRGQATCPRCKADLAPLMRLAAHAWMLRNRARQALAAGRFARAANLATCANQAQATRAGYALELCARLLRANAAD